MVEMAGLAWTEHRDPSTAAPSTSSGASAQGKRLGDLPLVLIHGAGGSRLSWPPALRRMPGAHVFAVDLPGHGRAPGEGRATVGGYSEAVLDWLRQQEIGPAVLIGHSMGAAIALTVAARRESLVAGLVLLGLARRLAVNPRLMELSATPETAPAAVEKVIEWGFAAGTPAERLEPTRQRMLEIAPAVLRGDFVACDHFDAGPRLGELRVATLVACGELDRMTPPEDCRRLAEAIPGSRFHLVPGAGHMLMIERPEEVAELVREFCAGL